MKAAAAIALLLFACDPDDSSSPKTDAAIQLIDSRSPDAPRPIDAGIDAIPGAVTETCTNLCNAIGVCVNDTDPSCVGECSADLADCTAQQLQTLDDCKTEACGDFKTKDGSPLMTCIINVACVEM